MKLFEAAEFDPNAPLNQEFDENADLNSDSEFDENAPLNQEFDQNLDNETEFNDNDFDPNAPLVDTELDNPNQDESDPNFQGIIRVVKGAVLVYKRKTQDDTYEELWVFNIGKDMKKESEIRRNILSGTDIDPQSGESEDGSQTAQSYSVGNVQFLQLSNIEN